MLAQSVLSYKVKQTLIYVWFMQIESACFVGRKFWPWTHELRFFSAFSQSNAVGKKLCPSSLAVENDQTIYAGMIIYVTQSINSSILELKHFQNLFFKL